MHDHRRSWRFLIANLRHHLRRHHLPRYHLDCLKIRPLLSALLLLSTSTLQTSDTRLAVIICEIRHKSHLRTTSNRNNPSTPQRPVRYHCPWDATFNSPVASLLLLQPEKSYLAVKNCQSSEGKKYGKRTASRSKKRIKKGKKR